MGLRVRARVRSRPPMRAPYADLGGTSTGRTNAVDFRWSDG